ncbi:MAG: general secretion pathway protein C [Rhodoferax sp.]|uniref:general secretion pathway protein C n=1 Tax=Rhodoferax sp. TaxID=50421 RepID=UPI0014015CA6|nr:general secretion pathway protein C [Rhodoferax sp.]NDP40344.1 general secretion pathway protein C [Rhodoferax sp.]
MKTALLSLWWLRMATFSLAALAAASATYWVLKWQATVPSNLTAAVVYTAPPAADPQVVARLLGGGQTSVSAKRVDSAASHFKLSGVLVNQASGDYAVISVDGKPAKPYRVGAHVNDDLVLHSVAPRSASLATSRDAPVSVTLELPKPTQASTLPARAATPTPKQEE